MGLFDDLLGGAKATNPVATTTNPTPATPPATSPIITQDGAPVGTASTSGIPMPAVDPMLVMNEQATSTPPSLDSILSISAGNVTPEMPSYTAQKELNTQQNTPSASPIIETSAPQAQADETVVMQAPEAPSPMLDLSAMTPASATTETPAIVIESETTEPALEVSSTIEMTTPVAESAPVIAEVEAPAVENIESFSLFGDIAAEETAEEVPAISQETEKEPKESGDALFGGLDLTETENTNTETMTLEVPDTTGDFIVAGIAQLEKMEQSLAERKQKFLDEAADYRAKKEEFADLEKEAIKNSKSMDEEQARIDAMKAYFKKQQDGANINDSVNTALAGASVKNAVDTTMEKKTNTRKRNAEKVAA